MIRLKVMSVKAEKRLQRSISESLQRGDKVTAARLRMELARAERYRAGKDLPRPGQPRRARGATSDVLLTLRHRGEISEEGFIAAEQIGEMWEALIKGRGLQAADYEPRIRGSGPYQGPIETLPRALDLRYRLVWTPWAAEMQRLYVLNEHGTRITGAISHFNVAIDVAAYHIPFGPLVRVLGCNRETGMDTLKTVFLSACDAWISAASDAR